MKKRVKIIIESIAGTGDPSARDMERKYGIMRRALIEQATAARNMGKQGRSPQEIDSLIAEEQKKDSLIPRVSGFTAPFSFKCGDEPLIDASLAEKWEAAGICMILPPEKKAAA